MKYTQLLLLACFLACCFSCAEAKKSKEHASKAMHIDVPVFDADSAYAHIVAQCAFGARVMNSPAHDRCGDYIAAAFRRYGLTVTEQKAVLTGYDGKRLRARNIIASFRPQAAERLLICAHWDSRPWADNDPDKANHRKPILAANDGASGVAVMLELARLLTGSPSQRDTAEGPSQRDTNQSPSQRDTVGQLSIGIDFICFDAEDYGYPYWEEETLEDTADTWCLGSRYWATHLHAAGYTARLGILLDMVGGEGATFYQEGFSRRYAPEVVNSVWSAAEAVGYSAFFPKRTGGHITDDHVPVNEFAHIPTIDIVPFYPDAPGGTSFGPTWHTLQDTPEHISRATLKAVGQTLLHVICYQ